MRRQIHVEMERMGEMRIPADACDGVQTARVIGNSSFSGLRFSGVFIHAMGLIKKHATITNLELEPLDPLLTTAIQAS